MRQFPLEECESMPELRLGDEVQRGDVLAADPFDLLSDRQAPRERPRLHRDAAESRGREDRHEDRDGWEPGTVDLSEAREGLSEDTEVALRHVRRRDHRS